MSENYFETLQSVAKLQVSTIELVKNLRLEI